MRLRFFVVALSVLLLHAPFLYATPPKRIERQSLLDALVPRKPINLKTLGVNAFANESKFGSVRNQLAEVKSRLKIRYIRVLFAWNDAVQASRTSAVNFSFYDDIARSVPSGVQALVVLTGLPSWAKALPDPRSAFIEQWVKPVVARYRANPRLNAFQIWNEPNDEGNADNTVLGIADPAVYVQMLTVASSAIHATSPGKLVVNAATTAIGQNYPKTLNYDRALIGDGITSVVDRFAIHFYGENYYNFLLPGGITDVLSKVSIPIWVTESGRQGSGRQREYVERAWPFLEKQVPKIERFYYYQFTEGSPSSSSYGLKYSGGVSDLYRYIASAKR